MIQAGFEQVGSTVHICEHAAELPDILQAVRPAAIVIAATGLKTTAMQWCQFSRAFTDLPIIVASSDADENEEINCLSHGAVDFVLNDRGLRVLVARTDSHIRRAEVAKEAGRPTSVGDLMIDADTRMATYKGENLNLTRTEFDIMHTLMINAHRVIHRRELIDRVWGTWYGDPHVLETHLSRLRNKVQMLGGPRIATPVRGIGYRLMAADTLIY
jgi:DNA-binding response OmpR family regulator